MSHRFTCGSFAAPLGPFIEGAGQKGGTVLGSSPTAAYLAFDDVVVAVTARAVPLMPNAMAVIERAGLEVFEAGAPVVMSGAGLRSGRVVLVWEQARPVDLAVPLNQGSDAPAAARRGRDLLQMLGREPDPIAAIAGACPELGTGEGLEGVRLLQTALIAGEPEVAGRAARLLTGRGPGLTPEGDDLLAAATAGLAAFERPISMNRRLARNLRAGFVLHDVGERTGSLSASLLGHAAAGWVIDPVRSLLDLTIGRATWGRSLDRLERIGHSTGRTYALGCALTAIALADGYRSHQANELRKEKT